MQLWQAAIYRILKYGMSTIQIGEQMKTKYNDLDQSACEIW